MRKYLILAVEQISEGGDDDDLIAMFADPTDAEAFAYEISKEYYSDMFRVTDIRTGNMVYFQAGILTTLVPEPEEPIKVEGIWPDLLD